MGLTTSWQAQTVTGFHALASLVSFVTLKKSHQIWSAVAQDTPAAKKAVNLLKAMLKRIERAGGGSTGLMQDATISDWQQDAAVANNEPADPFPGLSINGTRLHLPAAYVVVADDIASRLEATWQPTFSSGASIQGGFRLADGLLAGEPAAYNMNVPHGSIMGQAGMRWAGQVNSR